MIEPLTLKEVAWLQEEIESEVPFYSSIPLRYKSASDADIFFSLPSEGREAWETNFTFMLVILESEGY